MLANVLTGRRYFPKGPFHLGKYGTVVNVLAVLFIALFNVFYCFRKFSLSLSHVYHLVSPLNPPPSVFLPLYSIPLSFSK